MQVKDLQLKRVLRTALFVLLLGAVGMTKGYAYDFSAVCSTGQTLYYNITDATNHCVSVVYPGNSSSDPWNGFIMPTGNLVIPEIVTWNNVDYSVTAIGDYAFYNCSGLTDLTIGNSVTSIGNSAFYGCGGLTTVNWNAVNVTNYPDFGYTPFNNCTNLTTVVFGDQVQTIPARAFRECSSLTSTLTIPNSVTSIGNEAFYDCSGLTNLTIGNSVTSIGSSAFSGCSGLTDLTIPNSVTSIGNHAFHGCSGLTTVNWHAVNVTSYSSSYSAFSYCTNLTTVIFGEQVQTIPANAFYNCSSLAGILTIPNSVTLIGNHAFYGCSGLTGLTIGNSVTTIPANAFYNCSSLAGTLTIPNSVTSIGNYAFYGCSGLEAVNYTGDIAQWCTISFGNGDSNPTKYAHNLYVNNELVTHLVIPESITEIKQYTFYGYSGLTGLTIGESVSSIGSSAFSGCSGLTTVNWDAVNVASYPSSLSNPFRNCANLSAVVFSDQVQTIPANAFYNCNGLTTVNWNAVSVTSYPTSTSNHPFTNCTNLTSVVLGDQVQSLPAYAFYNCSGLETVYYTGDIAQWCNISFGNGDSNPTKYAHNLYVNNELVTHLVIPGSVTEIKNYAFYNYSGLTDLTIGNSVTSIGDAAFSGCSGLTGTLIIPNSVTSIGWSSFDGCSGLTGTLTIPNSVTSIGGSAFYNCRGLTGLTIGNSVTSIGDYTFNRCSGLTGTLTIPNSVTSIGKYAFEYCSGLTGLTIGNSVTSIGGSAFYGCSGLTGLLAIPNPVTSIGNYAFYGCRGLTGLTIGNSVTSIGNFAFYGCRGLTTVNWNAVNVTSYPTSTNNHPFKYCTNLTTVVIGEQVQKMPNYAFYNCSNLTTVNWNAVSVTSYPTSTSYHPFKDCINLTTVVFGDQVQTIPAYAFCNCSSLTDTLTIPNSVMSIGSSAFSGCSGLTTVNWDAVNVTNYPTSTNYHPFKDCTNLTTIVFGDQVQTIPAYAFCNCSSLTDTLTIPNSVTSIGNSVFSECSGLTTVNWDAVNVTSYPTSTNYHPFKDCTNLTTIVFGDQVQTIPAYAFYNCSSLTDTLTIPNSVTSIGNSAFSGCSGLTTVNWDAMNVTSYPTSTNYHPFKNCHNLTTAVFGNQIQTIPNSAFSGCSGLTTVHWNAVNVTSYPDSSSAFSNCTNLTTVVFGDQVQTIPVYAFYNCSSLTGTLMIPDSVTSIGDYAFSNCTGINAIRLQCLAPPTIAGNTFNNIDKSIPLFVACGTQEAYLAADYWLEFTAINESPYDLIITQNYPHGGEVFVVYADCEDNHCAILAINNIGYNFVGWYVNDELLTGSAYYEFTIDDDIVLEARYSRNANYVIANGSTNTWSNPNTWDTGEVPSSTSIVGIFRDVVVDVDAEVAQMGVYDDGSITISQDVTLTVTDELVSDTAISIVIEDGGQLYHSNNEAMATVKKSIRPYTTNANGWNLISFPLTGNGTVASIANMLSNRYDLYSYDEPTHYWINQKEEDNYFEALEEGKGYLYANSGSENVIYSFEDLNMDSWTTIDADGDGYNWEFTTTTAYTGTGCLQSSSWINETGRPLAPDNYIVSPQLMFNSSSSISFWASAQDTNYPADHFGVAVSTLSNTNPTDFTIIEEWTMTAKSVRAFGNWYQFTVDLGQFAGQIGYVALRHFNCIDQFRILVDEIRLSGVNLIEPQNVILSFVGELENGSATIMVPLNYTETVGNLKGFNLVGNPYVHNVTTYASTNVAEGCFRLNETKDNLIVSEVSENQPLKPAEGFFVKATAEGSSITFNPGRSRGENERKGFVNLELRENDKLIDRLIVKREGEPLEKLTLKENGTRLYAIQDHQEMAIISCEGNEQPFGFKASKNGNYTINVNADGLEFTYLHLIDNLTGNDVNVLVEPSYTFNAKTTDYASRFRLVFATGSSIDGDSFGFINGAGNLSIFGIEGEATVQVVDVLGHILSSETFNGSYEKHLDVAPGVYLLRLIQGNDVKVQKMVVK